MNKKEDNFLFDCLIVLASVLMLPYFTVKSIICDKSIKFYINELSEDVYKLSKSEE